MIFDRKVPLSVQRLRVALAKSKRNKGKNHGTGKLKSSIARMKAAKAKAKRKADLHRRREYNAQVRAYWTGNRADHPRLVEVVEVEGAEQSTATHWRMR